MRDGIGFTYGGIRWGNRTGVGAGLLVGSGSGRGSRGLFCFSGSFSLSRGGLRGRLFCCLGLRKIQLAVPLDAPVVEQVIHLGGVRRCVIGLGHNDVFHIPDQRFAGSSFLAACRLEC